MLVLRRKKGESLHIRVPGLQFPIRVCVVNVKGGVAQIGVNAPPNCGVLREEIDEEFIGEPDGKQCPAE